MTFSFRRAADQWSSPHERARYRAAERLSGGIDPAEEAWLESHLAGCPGCRATVSEYATQREELRSFRNQLPEPPRDLWARTAAAIEAERGSPSPRGTRRGTGWRMAVPLSALSGLLVVVVVVSAAFLGSRPEPRVAGPAGTPETALNPQLSSFVTPQATPLEVAADVGYVKVGKDGAALYEVPVDQVCPKGGDAKCAPIPDASPVAVPLPSKATSILRSPNDDNQQLVVLTAKDSQSGGSVVLVQVPGGSAPPAASPSPSLTATAPSTPAASPTGRPSSTPRTTIAMIEDSVIDSTAAYSRSGRWFAFSGRPNDGSHGSNIYLWQDGQTSATPITTDGASVFAGWVNERLIGGRAVPDTSGTDASPAPGNTAEGETFLVDPATGAREVIARRGLWRPSVDPTGQRAVYWNGNLELDANGVDWRPAEGSLVLGPWPSDTTTAESPTDASPSSAPSEPGASASAEPGTSPAASASLGMESAGTSPSPSTEPPTSPSSAAASASSEPSANGPIQVLRSGPIRDWDARWDETGMHLALWIADTVDPTVGHLSLYAVDPGTGRLERGGVQDVRALPGFAIGNNRLAYASPPGQDGKGSHVEVVAWTDSGIGQRETLPGDAPVIVVR